jgi:uncharacterized integral membrane protein
LILDLPPQLAELIIEVIQLTQPGFNRRHHQESHMTKQNATMVALAAVVLAIIALLLQVFFLAGHHTLTLGAEIAWPVLVIVAIAAFVYGRTLKS